MLWTLGEPQLWQPYPWSSTKVKVSESALRTAVFLSAATSEFDPIATGFLLTFWDHGKHHYLVTAKHCALELEPPFSLRVNIPRYRGDPGPSSDEIVVQEGEWIFHDDPNVDVAILEFPQIARLGRGCAPWSGNHQYAPERGGGVGPGDLTYTVGLFNPHSGVTRNVTLVHTGHIASFSEGERVTVADWDLKRCGKTGTKEIEAYVVQCSALPGLSGAPVFVREGIPATDQYHSHAQLSRGGNDKEIVGQRTKPIAYGEVSLLGIWQGSWEVNDCVKGGRNPSGYGVVVPAKFIYEVLESKPMKNKRDQANSEKAQKSGKVVALDSLPAKEVKQRFDATLKTMLSTPPDPQKKKPA